MADLADLAGESMALIRYQAKSYLIWAECLLQCQCQLLEGLSSARFSPD